MRRITCFLALIILVSSCNNEGGSTEKKLDSLGERIDTTAEKVWDSTKAKAKELKERIEDRFERKDSTDKKDTL